MAADDDAFADRVARVLAALPGVRAVTLGGSRAAGTHTPDSDWDFALHYRGPAFTPDALRAALPGAGWTGEVAEFGAWGGGVFNGGAWLTDGDGRHFDVHYRDLDELDRRTAEAQRGLFAIEPLLFHAAGIPTYLLLAEAAGSIALAGTVPRPAFPEALRRTAPERWWRGTALPELGYARAAHAARGHLAETAAALGRAGAQAAHAVLAARGEWVTNEKRLLDAAGLRGLDAIVAGLAARDARDTGDAEDAGNTGSLTSAVDAARALLGAAVEAAEAERDTGCGGRRAAPADDAR